MIDQLAKPSLTSFLHAMGNDALVAIRETVAIAERNEKSKYVERARHLLDIVVGSPPENLVEEARRKAIEEAAQRAEANGWPVKSASYGEYGDGFTDALNDASKLIAQNIRALLSAPTEARSTLEASNKGGK